MIIVASTPGYHKTQVGSDRYVCLGQGLRTLAAIIQPSPICFRERATTPSDLHGGADAGVICSRNIFDHSKLAFFTLIK